MRGNDISKKCKHRNYAQKFIMLYIKKSKVPNFFKKYRRVVQKYILLYLNKNKKAISPTKRLNRKTLEISVRTLDDKASVKV